MENVTKEQLNGIDVKLGQYKTAAIKEKELVLCKFVILIYSLPSRKALLASVRTNTACLVDNMTSGDVKGTVKHSEKLMQQVPKSENMVSFGENHQNLE